MAFGHLPGLAHGVGEARHQLGDQRFVAGSQPPGAVALGHGVARGVERRSQQSGAIGPAAGAEALVAR